MVDPKFDCYANIIKIRRDRNVSWELIDFFAESDEERTEEPSSLRHVWSFMDIPPLP